MAATGLALAAWSPKEARIPAFTSSTIMPQEPEGGAVDLTRLSSLLYLGNLPPPPPPPPPDPAEALKRYKFIGSAASGDRERALFAADGRVYSLRPGEILANFALSRIERDQAVFSLEDREVNLQLDPR